MSETTKTTAKAKADEAKPKNLYQRISAVMDEVQYLNKDKAVGEGNYSYKAISEESVTGTIREKMIKHGLVMFPVKQKVKHEELPRTDKYGKASILALTSVNVTYKLVNVDDFTQFELIVSSGTGVDPQDKGVGKAMTYAMKYALLRTFMVPTGNDPDYVHNDDLERNALAAAPALPAPTPDDYRAAIEACTSTAELKEVWSKIPGSIAKDLLPVKDAAKQLIDDTIAADLAGMTLEQYRAQPAAA